MDSPAPQAARVRAARRYDVATVDVFADRRFEGNPLAVVPDARGLSTDEMQALAAEFNLSETAFVLPPNDPAFDARVRIFHRTAEMPFAGHPLVGTAFVLARGAWLPATPDLLRFEVAAGPTAVRLTRTSDGAVAGATVEAPRPLAVQPGLTAAAVAACAGLDAADVRVAAHPPLTASVGTRYEVAEVTPAALGRAAPDLPAFRRALATLPGADGRCSLLLYARSDADQGSAGGPVAVRARMFAPLAGTWEDPATGSACAALGALLLAGVGAPSLDVVVRQGVEMGRPSVLQVAARRAADGVRAAVGGRCVPVLRGTVEV